MHLFFRVLVFAFWEQRTGVTLPILVSALDFNRLESGILAHVYRVFHIDYRTYEQVVEATHRFKSIFYDGE